MALGLEAGVSAAAWKTDTAQHTLHSALLMADGSCRCRRVLPDVDDLRLRAGPVGTRTGPWTGSRVRRPALTIPAMKPMAEKAGVTIGMAMTEKQGGSDVRANETRAVSIGGDEVELTGHKWFCSAPMSDAFLTLAYEGEGENAALSCFLVPALAARWHAQFNRDTAPERQAG